MNWGRLRVGMACVMLVTFGLLPGLSGVVYAASTTGDFNLQVTPSPLVATVDPGTKTQLELKVHNQGTSSENLSIAPRSFSFNSTTGQVTLNDTAPANISSWISFSEPSFTIQPGQWLTEAVTLTVPKNAGFSYSFALVITQQGTSESNASGRVIKGSLAVFSLINIDRPDATSNLSVVSFTATKRLYEYLPATLNIRFRNNGNTIVQPYGNVFIERSTNAKKPLATLAVNNTRSYILPDTERTISTEWNDGFATYQTIPQPDGSSSQQLDIDWSKLSRFRIGRYTAKLVAVYSDGNRDVPIEGEVSFWVIPWLAIIICILGIVGLWLLLHWRGKRRTEKAVKRALAAAETARKKTDAHEA